MVTQKALRGGQPVDSDPTLGANSDALIPTQKAVRTIAKRGCVLCLCVAFDPAGTGADIAEIVVPFSPNDGVTALTWAVRKIALRVNVAGGDESVIIEKSAGLGAFSATTIDTVTLGTGVFEDSINPVDQTVDSGDKLRFNVAALGTATGWTVEVELGEA